MMCSVVKCGFCVDENGSMGAVIHEESEISDLFHTFLCGVLICVMRCRRALDFASALCELQRRIWTGKSSLVENSESSYVCGVCVLVWCNLCGDDNGNKGQ